MTRINLVDPSELTDAHLVAEYRELPRIFGLIRSWQARRAQAGAVDEPIPEAYILGPGHVRFFYDKAGWLVARQRSLVTEMLRRGFNPQHRDPEQLLEGIDPAWQQAESFVPPAEAIALNRARIAERLRDQRREPRRTAPAPTSPQDRENSSFGEPTP